MPFLYLRVCRICALFGFELISSDGQCVIVVRVVVYILWVVFQFYIPLSQHKYEAVFRGQVVLVQSRVNYHLFNLIYSERCPVADIGMSFRVCVNVVLISLLQRKMRGVAFWCIVRWFGVDYSGGSRSSIYEYIVYEVSRKQEIDWETRV